MEGNALTFVLLGIMLLAGGVFFIITRRNSSANSNNSVRNEKRDDANKSKKEANNNVAKEDIFKFMEFDKIEDNMIIQNNGEKYTAVIKCKGINYNLLSEVEQLGVEEGFINFLNTLKFPIQLYVQAQNIDLKDNIEKYKENMKDLYEKYDDANTEYGMLVNSLDSSEEELDKAEKERNSILNVLEYGQDIVRYVERLSLNKSMLQRNFYVLVSYYKSEITNVSNFSNEEAMDICYSELFTRVENIMSGLSMCSVSGEILDSNDIAELIYSAYNRDDKNYISVQQALDSGFLRLYSTSKDAITKRQERLMENIQKEAKYKAVSALVKAIDEGNYATPEDIEEEFDEETSKKAIELIKKENIDEEIKQKAKKIVIDEYKEAKKERIERKQKTLNDVSDKIGEKLDAARGIISPEKTDNTENEADQTAQDDQNDDSIIH